MRLLLDTHVLIWLMEDDGRLTAQARELIAGAEDVFVSSASIWEIAIKTQLGKLKIDVERLILRMAESGIDELAMTSSHAVMTGKLPLLHRDPFDRLLVAQAICEPMRLLTADAKLKAYSELVVVL